MPGAELHLPAGTVVPTATPVVVTPERAGWDAAAACVIVRCVPGESRVLATGTDELALLPLSGGGVDRRGGRPALRARRAGSRCSRG